jgi:major membrane immunogen (membrane-anchored lipoprotein)
MKIKKLSKNILGAVAIGAMVLSTAACSTEQKASTLAPGDYKRTVRSTDANGTETTQYNETKIDVDDDGNRKTVIQSETTKDPEGMFNKKTVKKSKQVIEENN